MLAPHIKKKVDKLWDRFWSAGLTNPLVAVEQITYLLFLKRIEDIDLKRIERGLPSIYAFTPTEQKQIDDAKPKDRAQLRRKLDSEPCRWSYIRQEKTNPTHLIDKVFPWLRGIASRLSQQEDDTELASLNNRMADANFQLDPQKGQVLADAIDLIDQLFARAGDGSAAQDIMGDTFEYLLSEMATAGKNGQFRTPRHLIRFMVELLDPKPGQRIIDPAAGTGGFLFSAQQYLMRKYSAQENLRIEWDGTPHRTDGAAASAEQYAAIHHGANFVGLDNDRTMARIGWMNLILHDVTDPHLLQGDSLSKREGKPKLAELLSPESYEFVLANPPFTGTVDTLDLEPDPLTFPRAADKGKKKNDVLTNKSELLFLWLMLDLLQIGGRCAVIIPEGVLFGNTDAHVRLRRELLTEHVVEGVISLPGGVFQPYTGVKTSILIFRKVNPRANKKSFTGQQPETKYVWFYEIGEGRDGYSSDAKRTPRPLGENDLWDALVKFKEWLQKGRNIDPAQGKTYYQPKLFAERWRQAQLRDADDKLTPAGEAFSSLPDTGMWDGHVWGIHELFDGLPSDPKQAEEHVIERSKAIFHNAMLTLYVPAANKALQEIGGKPSLAQDRAEVARKHLDKAGIEVRRAVTACKKFFEDPEDANGWRLFQMAAEDARRWAYDSAVEKLDHEQGIIGAGPALEQIAREFAKLDGFDVTLRSLEIDQLSEVPIIKHWTIPVRDWLRNNEWKSANGKLKGSHDKNGLVRPQYVESMLAEQLYDDKGVLKEGRLEPDCIEAREWNLSAGQFKPFDFAQLKSDKSISELIDELRSNEQRVMRSLDALQMMVGDRK
jgi:type I restriction enzyme M protein